MISKSILEYISFGMSFRYLQDTEEGWAIFGDALVLHNIKSFFIWLDELELHVTRRASDDLKKFRDELAEREKNAKLSKEDVTKLTGLIIDIRKTLHAETRGHVAYIVTEKRLDVEKLLNNVPGLFGSGVFEGLPEIAQFDFMEAGKCVAFERPTAAAFHILRGTEAVLRKFYCKVVKRKRSKLMWGPMLESLRARTKPPSAPLLNNLDNIRLSYRNPTQHPEMIYNMDEVQDLVGLCIGAVNTMCRSPKSP